MAELLDSGYAAAKIREQRLFDVPLKDKAGDFKLKMRRPTDVEMAEMRHRIGGASVLEFVSGWEGVTEGHLIPGGAGHMMAFSKETAIEWLSDRGDILPEIVNALLDSYKAHAEKIGLIKKK